MTADDSEASLVPSINQETFFGLIESVDDAMLVVDAARMGRLPRVRTRLTDRERRSIRSGSVFVFLETESRIRRWTDGKAWSPSRITGEFLIYREIISNDLRQDCGLVKRTISLGVGMEAYHLVAYYRDSDRPVLGPYLPTKCPFFTRSSRNPVFVPADVAAKTASMVAAARSAMNQNDLTGHFRLPSLGGSSRAAKHASTASRQPTPIAPHPSLPTVASASATSPASQASSLAKKPEPDEDQLLFSHFLSSLHSSLSASWSASTSVSSPLDSMVVTPRSLTPRAPSLCAEVNGPSGEQAKANSASFLGC